MNPDGADEAALAPGVTKSTAAAAMALAIAKTRLNTGMDICFSFDLG
ncbi:hypothetical protein [Streptomyces fuscichromogenes]|nr:hypothetical protein [Streptomyces fuscichromogenes]